MKPKPKTTLQKAKAKAAGILFREVWTMPCPDCGTECELTEVNEPEQRKEVAPNGKVFVYPNHYLALDCTNCHLQSWIALDENGKPYPEDVEELEISHTFYKQDVGTGTRKQLDRADISRLLKQHDETN
jgi:hypothetical protein